ncbi:hypothetical protein [Staphylococcus caeli]
MRRLFGIKSMRQIIKEIETSVAELMLLFLFNLNK